MDADRSESFSIIATHAAAGDTLDDSGLRQQRPPRSSARTAFMPKALLPPKRKTPRRKHDVPDSTFTRSTLHGGSTIGG